MKWKWSRKRLRWNQVDAKVEHQISPEITKDFELVAAAVAAEKVLTAVRRTALTATTKSRMVA